jgi:hypothetical protein
MMRNYDDYGDDDDDDDDGLGTQLGCRCRKY